jgi:SAM-dependent methyltransferase
MSRIESVAKGGYYPTPFRVADAIARFLIPTRANGKRVVRLLDPCAGTGEAAATLAEALGAERFGIELNAERAEAARVHLDHLLATSAFAVRLSHGSFSCLFLNPPYHHDDEKRRLEHAFLTSLTRTLCPGGVLVFLIPQRRLAISARYLASHYAGFRAYRFPDPEYAAFRQMVLFAVRKPQATPDPTAQAQLETWSRAELPPLPELPVDGSRLAVPALPAGEVRFASLFFDPLQAAVEAQRQGVWVQPQFTEQLWPADEPPVRPLMPLRKGHLALLIAAGMLNNIVLRQKGHRVLVKGRTYKEPVPVESGDELTEIEREVLRTAITVLDLRTGDLEVIDPGSNRPAVPEPDAA